jgi:DNA mismatch repair ATPase MutS
MAGAASLQTNQVLWPLVNMVIPWDMYFSMKMEDLKKELEPKLTEWLDDFYELEVLNSIANFGYLNPSYSFPDFEPEGKTLLEASDLGHPLIHYTERVTNDFTVKQGNDLFLITGSNMAGKSTFLRTVGVNLVLAFAGAPVNASDFYTREFRVFTSINVKDSLEGGLSHFYAEVRRLRRLLDELEGDHSVPLFFFVDEIFKGTNNRERFQGSTAFLKNVAGKNGVGMVSTHDLELASLEEEISGLSNWHFAETIENGKMSFEYKIKEGPCPTTNALKIMQMEGLPVE